MQGHHRKSRDAWGQRAFRGHRPEVSRDSGAAFSPVGGPCGGQRGEVAPLRRPGCRGGPRPRVPQSGPGLQKDGAVSAGPAACGRSLSLKVSRPSSPQRASCFLRELLRVRLGSGAPSHSLYRSPRSSRLGRFLFTPRSDGGRPDSVCPQMRSRGRGCFSRLVFLLVTAACPPATAPPLLRRWEWGLAVLQGCGARCSAAPRRSSSALSRLLNFFHPASQARGCGGVSDSSGVEGGALQAGWVVPDRRPAPCELP